MNLGEVYEAYKNGKHIRAVGTCRVMGSHCEIVWFDHNIYPHYINCAIINQHGVLLRTRVPNGEWALYTTYE